MGKRAKLRRARMQAWADKNLEGCLPRSERWFRDFWESENLKDPQDQYNRVWCRRIPDILNHKYQYVIEIDGTYHNKPKQKEVDAKKDRFYRAQRYEVIRVKAFDQESANAAAEIVERIRQRI